VARRKGYQCSVRKCRLHFRRAREIVDLVYYRNRGRVANRQYTGEHRDALVLCAQNCRTLKAAGVGEVGHDGEGKKSGARAR
jgi:hypothetical protein